MFIPKERVYWGEGTPKTEEFKIGEDEILSIKEETNPFSSINPEYFSIAYGGIPSGFVKETGLKKILRGLKLNDKDFLIDLYFSKKYPDLVFRHEYTNNSKSYYEIIHKIAIGPKKDIIVKDLDYFSAPIFTSEAKCEHHQIDKLWVKRELMEKIINYISGNYQPEDKVEKQLLDLIMQLSREGIELEQGLYKILNYDPRADPEATPQLTPEEELLIKILSNYEIPDRENYKNISSGLDKQEQSN